MEVSFCYEGLNTIIQCKENEKMKDIINRFLIKIQSNTNLFYLYNGTKINFELTFNEQANDIDKRRKKMNIIVTKRDEDRKEFNEMISKDIICPECRENILIDIKDYKINLFGCKYNHFQQNILLNLFEESQKINLNEIICGFCQKTSKKNTHNNEFYICNTCKKNLCPLCKSVHDTNHRIINYIDKNYICESHNESFIKFCENCIENVCIICEKNHKNHKLFDLSQMIIEKNELLLLMKNLKNVLDKIRYKINSIKEVLNHMLRIFDLYYKINNELVQNYNINKRNYYKLRNMNYLKDNNETLIKELNNVIWQNKIYEYSIDKFYNEYGEKYLGEMKNGNKEGTGIFFYNKDDISQRKLYEGNFKNDKREGKGIIEWINGDKYQGDFKNGKREGKGTIFYDNGNQYIGEWKNDKKEGKGKMLFSSGDTYEGDWKNNTFDGKGKMLYNNNETYEGSFKNGLKDGQGIYHYKNGNIYNGDYKNDKREGKGIEKYNNGDVYKGDYNNDKREGKGTYYYNNGGKYIGDFKNGKKDGKGIEYDINGSRYEGDFKNGHKEGYGVCFYNNGTKDEGYWENDNLIKKENK